MAFNEYLSGFSFDLPDSLIARYPLQHRDQSRLLVLNRKEKSISDHLFSDLPDILDKNDILILNNSRVSQRRVYLQRESGAVLPALFMRPFKNGWWLSLIKGSGRLKADETLSPVKCSDGLKFIYRPLSKNENKPDDCLKSTPGAALLKPLANFGETEFRDWTDIRNAEAFFEKCGTVPIPPYLKRLAESIDEERYQTIFARKPGSIAAPTAGLHFSSDLFHSLKLKGISTTEIALHIGYGTFAPLSDWNFQNNRLHTEKYFISEKSRKMMSTSFSRRVAVGTTVLRALESNHRENSGCFKSGHFTTSLFIHPPDQVLSIEALITNFHLPDSSLLLLVSAFSGRESLQAAYEHAIAHRYRFYSYGDAMLIL